LLYTKVHTAVNEKLTILSANGKKGQLERVLCSRKLFHKLAMHIGGVAHCGRPDGAILGSRFTPRKTDQEILVKVLHAYLEWVGE
jgi:hypothetical protein